MKNLMRKFALVLSLVLVVGAFAGCAKKFDASAYLQAVLDNSYKNDPSGLVKLGYATEEEANQVYEEGLDAEFQAMLTTAGITEDQAGDLRTTMGNMLAATKYEVGEAEKQDDGSYVVTVTYEQINVYEIAITNYMEAVTAFVEDYTAKVEAGEEVPSYDELMTEVVEMFAPIIDEALATATYDEPQTTTVRIELVDKKYTPNQSDLQNLGMLLFDNDAVQ